MRLNDQSVSEGQLSGMYAKKASTGNEKDNALAYLCSEVPGHTSASSRLD
jgi:hypothetical protein